MRIQGEVIAHPELDANTTTAVTQTRWRGKQNRQVRLYTLEGSGHVFPSRTRRSPRFLGGDAADLDGAEEIVNFFLQSPHLTPASPAR